jgi:aerobic carbon-monoxide dehydrogenase medium subunit
MYEFNYHRASSLDEAKAMLGQGDDPTLMAGGMTLIPTLKQRLAMPSDLIDLGGISDLAGIRLDGKTLVIGAMTKHDTVARSQEVKGSIPALAELAAHIGDPMVRNRGTIGGSIANNDPAADYPAGLVALGATVVTTSREIAADDFFTGLFETALETGEIIREVRFPIPRRAAYVKFPNPASRYAVVGVFVAETDDGVRVGVTGAAACAYRHTEMEQALNNAFSPDAIKGMKGDVSQMNSDIHASAEYRAHLVGVMARRAVASIA